MSFRLVLSLLIVFLESIVYLQVRRWLRDRPGPTARRIRTLTTVLFCVFGFAMFMALFLRPQITEWPAAARTFGVYPFYLWHSTILILGLVLLTAGLVTLPFRLASRLLRLIRRVKSRARGNGAAESAPRFDASRRSFVRAGFAGVAGMTLAGTTYGMFVERQGLEIVGVDCPIPALPASFDGFRICLISDIHSGPFMARDQMEEVVRRTNSLRADLIIVNGDFVNGAVREVYPFCEAFSALRAPHGVRGVTGNHEYYTGDPVSVTREVDSCGVRLLRDSWEEIRVADGRIVLAGVDDVGRNASKSINLDNVVRDMPRGVPSIFLCHRPYYFPLLARSGVDLALCGHTHGGQIVLGRFGETVLAPAAFVSPYVAGMYAIGASRMYVTRGIGTVGLPLRVNCPPEITVLTLRREGAGEPPGDIGRA